MVNGLALVGLNQIKVPSEDDPNVCYIVDTVLGKCECTIGSSGAPCKHQFVIWATMKRSNPNFMPFFCKEERMLFARIAIGDSAVEDPSLYDDLRIVTDVQVDALQELEIIISSDIADVSNNDSQTDLSITAPHSTTDHLTSASLITQQKKEIALKDLDESYEILRNMLSSSTADASCFEGISKFRKRLEKLSRNQTVSALHTFGSLQYLRKQNPAIKSAIKRAHETARRRAQRNQINVQPASTQRRVNKNGSKKRLLCGGTQNSKMTDLPKPTQGKRKRGHVLSENTAMNVMSAKKHSVTMKSKSRPTYKKKENK